MEFLAPGTGRTFTYLGGLLMRNNRRPRPQRWRKPRRPAGPRYGMDISARRWRPAAALLLFTGILLFSGWRLHPVLRTASAHEANLACTRAINDAVGEQLKELQPRYETLVSLSRNGQGSVTAAETNIAMADRLKTAVTSSILAAFQEETLQQISIPLGTLTGSLWLNGRGPRIPLRIIPSRAVSVDIQSAFTDAGINQTRHQLLLTVEADAEAILPGLSSSTHVSSRFLLAETVIVGEVPKAYASIQGTEELAGKVADYGATGLPLPLADGAKPGQ